jgi:hypothetical protein
VVLEPDCSETTSTVKAECLTWRKVPEGRFLKDPLSKMMQDKVEETLATTMVLTELSRSVTTTDLAESESGAELPSLDMDAAIKGFDIIKLGSVIYRPSVSWSRDIVDQGPTELLEQIQQIHAFVGANAPEEMSPLYKQRLTAAITRHESAIDNEGVSFTEDEWSQFGIDATNIDVSRYVAESEHSRFKPVGQTCRLAKLLKEEFDDMQRKDEKRDGIFHLKLGRQQVLDVRGRKPYQPPAPGDAEQLILRDELQRMFELDLYTLQVGKAGDDNATGALNKDRGSSRDDDPGSSKRDSKHRSRSSSLTESVRKSIADRSNSISEAVKKSKAVQAVERSRISQVVGPKLKDGVSSLKVKLKDAGESVRKSELGSRVASVVDDFHELVNELRALRGSKFGVLTESDVVELRHRHMTNAEGKKVDTEQVKQVGKRTKNIVVRVAVGPDGPRESFVGSSVPRNESGFVYFCAVPAKSHLAVRSLWEPGRWKSLASAFSTGDYTKLMSRPTRAIEDQRVKEVPFAVKPLLWIFSSVESCLTWPCRNPMNNKLEGRGEDSRCPKASSKVAALCALIFTPNSWVRVRRAKIGFFMFVAILIFGFSVVFIPKVSQLAVFESVDCIFKSCKANRFEPRANQFQCTAVNAIGYLQPSAWSDLVDISEIAITLLLIVLLVEVTQTIKGDNDVGHTCGIYTADDAAVVASDMRLALTQVIVGFASVVTIVLGSREYSSSCLMNALYHEDDGSHSIIIFKPNPDFFISGSNVARATLGNVALVTVGIALKNVQLKIINAFASVEHLAESFDYAIRKVQAEGPSTKASGRPSVVSKDDLLHHLLAERQTIRRLVRGKKFIKTFAVFFSKGIQMWYVLVAVVCLTYGLPFIGLAALLWIIMFCAMWPVLGFAVSIITRGMDNDDRDKMESSFFVVKFVAFLRSLMIIVQGLMLANMPGFGTEDTVMSAYTQSLRVTYHNYFSVGDAIEKLYIVFYFDLPGFFNFEFNMAPKILSLVVVGIEIIMGLGKESTGRALELGGRKLAKRFWQLQEFLKFVAKWTMKGIGAVTGLSSIFNLVMSQFASANEASIDDLYSEGEALLNEAGSVGVSVGTFSAAMEKMEREAFELARKAFEAQEEGMAEEHGEPSAPDASAGEPWEWERSGFEWVAVGPDQPKGIDLLNDIQDNKVKEMRSKLATALEKKYAKKEALKFGKRQLRDFGIEEFLPDSFIKCELGSGGTMHFKPAVNRANTDPAAAAMVARTLTLAVRRKTYQELRGALGLQWQSIGASRPVAGRELLNSKLAAELKRRSQLGRANFTVKEWEAFGEPALSVDDFIRSGPIYFQPVGGAPRESLTGYALPKDQGLDEASDELSAVGRSYARDVKQELYRRDNTGAASIFVLEEKLRTARREVAHMKDQIETNQLLASTLNSRDDQDDKVLAALQRAEARAERSKKSSNDETAEKMLLDAQAAYTVYVKYLNAKAALDQALRLVQQQNAKIRKMDPSELRLELKKNAGENLMQTSRTNVESDEPMAAVDKEDELKRTQLDEFDEEGCTGVKLQALKEIREASEKVREQRQNQDAVGAVARILRSSVKPKNGGAVVRAIKACFAAVARWMRSCCAAVTAVVHACLRSKEKGTAEEAESTLPKKAEPDIPAGSIYQNWEALWKQAEGTAELGNLIANSSQADVLIDQNVGRMLLDVENNKDHPLPGYINKKAVEFTKTAEDEEPLLHISETPDALELVKVLADDAKRGRRLLSKNYRGRMEKRGRKLVLHAKYVKEVVDLAKQQQLKGNPDALPPPEGRTAKSSLGRISVTKNRTRGTGKSDVKAGSPSQAFTTEHV